MSTHLTPCTSPCHFAERVLECRDDGDQNRPDLHRPLGPAEACARPVPSPTSGSPRPRVSVWSGRGRPGRVGYPRAGPHPTAPQSRIEGPRVGTQCTRRGRDGPSIPPRRPCPTRVGGQVCGPVLTAVHAQGPWPSRLCPVGVGPDAPRGSRLLRKVQWVGPGTGWSRNG